MHTINHCESSNTCRKCNERHHTLINLDRWDESFQINQNKSTLSISTSSNKEVLLTIAIIHVKNTRGEFVPLRVLLALGSQNKFITK